MNKPDGIRLFDWCVYTLAKYKFTSQDQFKSLVKSLTVGDTECQAVAEEAWKFFQTKFKNKGR